MKLAPLQQNADILVSVLLFLTLDEVSSSEFVSKIFQDKAKIAYKKIKKSNYLTFKSQNFDIDGADILFSDKQQCLAWLRRSGLPNPILIIGGAFGSEKLPGVILEPYPASNKIDSVKTETPLNGFTHRFAGTIAFSKKGASIGACAAVLNCYGLPEFFGGWDSNVERPLDNVYSLQLRDFLISKKDASEYSIDNDREYLVCNHTDSSVDSSNRPRYNKIFRKHWRQMVPLPRPLSYASAVCLTDGTVVVLGGASGPYRYASVYKDCYVRHQHDALLTYERLVLEKVDSKSSNALTCEACGGLIASELHAELRSAHKECSKEAAKEEEKAADDVVVGVDAAGDYSAGSGSEDEDSEWEDVDDDDLEEEEAEEDGDEYKEQLNGEPFRWRLEQDLHTAARIRPSLQSCLPHDSLRQSLVCKCFAAVVGATPTLNSSGQAIDSNAIMTALPQKQSECFSTSRRLQQREATDQGRGALQGRSTNSLPHSPEQNNIADTIWKNNIIPPMLSPRCGHISVSNNVDQIITAGGYMGRSDYLSSAEWYTPGAAQWEALPDMHLCRSGAAACLGLSGEVIVAGGSDDGSRAHITVERLDLRTRRWEYLAPMNKARAYTAGCLGRDGLFYVSGGLANQAFTFDKTIDVYDIRADRWQLMTVAEPSMSSIACEEQWSFTNKHESFARASHHMFVLPVMPVVALH